MARTQVARSTAAKYCVAFAAVALSAVANAAAAERGAGRLTVCAMSLNEPHELETFRAQLDAKRFAFVDLRATSAAVQPAAFGATDDGGAWLNDACRSQTRCDIVVYTAEFAGRFFGKQGSIGLQQLEEASCQASCAGLFQQPLEVFLMACNTLATKDEDNRSPAQYLQVLLEHGFDRGAAERVVELRYGPLGPSFRESLRRIFAGVPRIYGFSSVAPRGEITAPKLASYLRSQGDYAQTLRRKARTAQRNTALLTAFKGTAMTQTTGLSAAEAGAADRRDICALYDESRPVLERLRITYGLLQQRDALRFVPTLQVFLSRHPRAGLGWLEQSVLSEIRALEAPREQVMQLVERLNVSALKLELAHFAELVGWLHPSELHAIAVDAARHLLRQPLSAEVVDIMCEVTKHAPLHTAFDADDIPAALYVDAQGLRLLSCLAPRDPRVATQLAAVLATPDPVRRQWAAHALTRLQPRDEETLLTLVPYRRDAAPAVASRIDWLLHATQMPRAVWRAMREQDESAPAPRDDLEITRR